MTRPTSVPTQATDHAADSAHLPTELPANYHAAHQLGQAIAATFPPPAIANTTTTPAADVVAAHVPLVAPHH